MNGFDPSAFVDAEQPSLPLSPPVANPDAPAGAAGAAAQVAQVAQNRDVWAANGGSVAGVATVAGIDELALDLPYAAELNSMLFFERPGKIMPGAWRRILRGAFGFVQSGQCAKALALGWEPIELFGYHTRPWSCARVPHYTIGVVAGLHGCATGEITEERIEMISRHKPYMHFYRAHFMTGRRHSAMIWEALDVRRWPPDEVT